MKKFIVLLIAVFGFTFSQAATIEKKSSPTFETQKVKKVDSKDKNKNLTVKIDKKFFACATGVGTISGSCWAIDLFVDYCCDCEPVVAFMIATMSAQSQVREYTWLLTILETEQPC